MITKSDIMEEAHRLGFGDVGFTTAEPFVSHLDYLRDHQDEYGWAERAGLDLIRRHRSQNGPPHSTIDHCSFGSLCWFA